MRDILEPLADVSTSVLFSEKPVAFNKQHIAMASYHGCMTALLKRMLRHV